jgi:hypothetical protein
MPHDIGVQTQGLEKPKILRLVRTIPEAGRIHLSESSVKKKCSEQNQAEKPPVIGERTALADEA